MSILIVVDNPLRWPLHIPGVDVVSARSYLTEAAYSEDRTAKVFNLCRSYRYQSMGYYVSLLAEARGHKPLPNITTIQDLRSRGVIRTRADDMDEIIGRALKPLHSNKFTLSIYFGKNLAGRYDGLSLRLFNLFPAPLLRAEFMKSGNRWELRSIRAISAGEIPEGHRQFVIDAATEYFARRKRRTRRREPRFDIAILVGEDDSQPPSNARALQKFAAAAAKVGMEMEFITRDDYARIAQFDALFIRETTSVNHHTYRFSQRAAAEGLVVIDDPDSIVKCTNKVYLAEVLDRYGLRRPKTLIVHRDNVAGISAEIGFPCVLKQPDSAYSLGVTKVDEAQELENIANGLLDKSELIIAQEFIPTDFDWRIGVLDRRPLYVCRYMMAGKHWQIIHRKADGRILEGGVETLSVGEAPAEVVASAVRAANLMGDGLYGVDVKQLGRKCYIMEVNDNPSIDAGYEDTVLKDALYREIMGVFLRRIEARKLRLPVAG